MSEISQRLVDEIAQETDVATGVLTLCTTVAQAFRENASDVRRVTGLADALDANKHAFALAVVAKTQALPEPTHDLDLELDGLNEDLRNERFARQAAEEKLAEDKAEHEIALRRWEGGLQDEHNLRLDLQERLAELEKQLAENAAQEKTSKKGDGKAKPLTGDGKPE